MMGNVNAHPRSALEKMRLVIGPAMDILTDVFAAWN